MIVNGIDTIAILKNPEQTEKERCAALLNQIKTDYEGWRGALQDQLFQISCNPLALQDPVNLLEYRVILLALAHFRNNEALATSFRLAEKNEYCTLFEEGDWCVRELHRIWGAMAKEDDLPFFTDMVLNKTLKLEIREQALLAIHFIWLERIASEKDIVEQYKTLLHEGLEVDDDWHLWMALLVNSAVVGGVKLKPMIMETIESGRLGGQTPFVRRVVNGLFGAGSQRFKEVFRKEHKGLYTDLDAELEDVFKITKDEEIKMPEKGKTIVREEPKVGRNDPCPCGSGKKYKKCCGMNQP